MIVVAVSQSKRSEKENVAREEEEGETMNVMLMMIKIAGVTEGKRNAVTRVEGAKRTVAENVLEMKRTTRNANYVIKIKVFKQVKN